MSKTDVKTGLPIITPEKKKHVVIDNPQLVVGLRELEQERQKTDSAAQIIGRNLVVMISTAAAVGQAAFVSDQKWQAELFKIAGLYGVKPEQVVGTDLDSKDGPVITLK